MLPCMAMLRLWSTCCSVLVTGAWGTGELQRLSVLPTSSKSAQVIMRQAT
jgi:hypothetical protein